MKFFTNYNLYEEKMRYLCYCDKVLIIKLISYFCYIYLITKISL